MARMGSPARADLKVRNLTPEELARNLPRLQPSRYEVKSHATPRYNCVAFANGDERHWWEAGVFGGRFFWPPEIREDSTLQAWRQLFVSQGYVPTTNRNIELGFEKVAIYVSLEDFSTTHVAKSDGRVWKSKLGKGQDIDHYALDVLEGDQEDEYGVVELVLKRVAPKK